MYSHPVTHCGSDGDLDLFVTTADGVENYLYRNENNGASFTNLQPNEVGELMTSTTAAVSAQWVDWTGDGRVDLFVKLGASPYFDLFRTETDGTFTKVDDQELSSIRENLDSSGADDKWYDYAWGDYDGDGCVDVVFGLAVDADVILRNDCNGAFIRSYHRLLATTICTDQCRPAVRWFDYDSDGFLDLLTTAVGLVVKVYHHDPSTGGFDAITSINSLAGLEALAFSIEDLDNDGDLDVYAGAGTSQIAQFIAQGDVPRVFYNKGAGATQYSADNVGAGLSFVTYGDAAMFYAGHSADVKIVDVDNDGFQDLLRLTQITYPVPGGAEDVWAVQIFTTAGSPDLVMRTQIPQIHGSGTNGEPNFGTNLADSLGSRAVSCMTLGDMNGDFLPDLALHEEVFDEVTTSTIRKVHIYRNMGGGNFSHALALTLPHIVNIVAPTVFCPRLNSFNTDAAYNSQLTWVDIDGDGNDDLSVTSLLYRSIGDGTFAPPVSLPCSSATVRSIYADTDNDGDLDLLCAGGLFTNDGMMSFTTANDLVTRCNYDLAEFLDYNQDGWIDVVCAGDLFRNSGGSFTESTTTAFRPAGITSPTPGDELTAVYIGIVAMNQSESEVSVSCSIPRVGDYNGDGYPDIFYLNTGCDLMTSNQMLFRNNAVPGLLAGFTGVRSSTTAPFVTFGGVQGALSSDAAWGDLNGDGRLDLVITNSASADKLYYYKTCSGNAGAVPEETLRTSSMCVTCPSTTVFYGDACYECPRGLIVGQSGLCTFNCPAGYARDFGEEACSACAVGKRHDPISLVCLDCPAGKTAENPGAVVCVVRS